MKLEIELDYDMIPAYLNELYTKGCKDVADAIEKEYFKQVDKKQEDKEILDYFKSIKERFGANRLHYTARYCKRKNGEIVCLYEFILSIGDTTKKIIVRKPFIFSNGKVFGRPESIKWIEHFYYECLEHGYEEVE